MFIKFNTIEIVSQYLAFKNPNYLITNDAIDTIIITARKNAIIQKYRIKLETPISWVYEDGYLVVAKNSKYEKKYELVVDVI